MPRITPGTTNLATIRLKHVTADRDRHGKIRYYVRLPGVRKKRLRGLPGSEEFMAGYQAAISKVEDKPRLHRIASPGSFRATVAAYYATPEFMGLDGSTKAWRRRALDRVCREHGDNPIRRMESKHVRRLRDARTDTPAAANTLLKALRALFSWAVEVQLASHDPTKGVKPIRYASTGFHTWTLEEISQYENTHPLGSKARLALALLRYTTGRREDVVRLGPQHVRAGRLRYTQAKNEHRKPVQINIPVHAELATIIEATPSANLTFLVTEYGRPFSPAGFGNRFREWCNQAGLPRCSAHGLRKAAAAQLAERGATPHEIMAITGHQTLVEVERYTKAAKLSALADRGMAKL